MVHQNHEEEKNSSEFFEADPVEEPFGFFSSLIFPAGTSDSPAGGGGACDVSVLRVVTFPHF